MIMKLGPDTDKPTVSLVKSQTQEGGLKRIGKRLVAGFDEVVKVIGAQTNINHWLLRWCQNRKWIILLKVVCTLIKYNYLQYFNWFCSSFQLGWQAGALFCWAAFFGFYSKSHFALHGSSFIISRSLFVHLRSTGVLDRVLFLYPLTLWAFRCVVASYRLNKDAIEKFVYVKINDWLFTELRPLLKEIREWRNWKCQ